MSICSIFSPLGTGINAFGSSFPLFSKHRDRPLKMNSIQPSLSTAFDSLPFPRDSSATHLSLCLSFLPMKVREERNICRRQRVCLTCKDRCICSASLSPSGIGLKARYPLRIPDNLWSAVRSCSRSPFTSQSSTQSGLEWEAGTHIPGQNFLMTSAIVWYVSCVLLHISHTWTR